MKKNLFVVSIIILFFMVSGCKTQSKKPENVAESFLIHLSKNEYTEAKKMATGDALEIIELLQSFSAISSSDTTEVIEIKTPVIENMNCQITDKEALCTYIQDGKEGTIELQNVKGHWRVSNFPKENSDSPQNVATDTINNLIYNDSVAYLNLSIADTGNLFGFANIRFEISSLYYKTIDELMFTAELFDKTGKQLGEKQLISFENVWPESYTDDNIRCSGININDIGEIRLIPVSLVIDEESRNFIPSTLTISDDNIGIKITIR
jgi:hypothetical protein